MDNKKYIIIVLILIIIFFSGYYLIKNDNSLSNSNNDDNIECNISKDISLNVTNASSNIRNNSSYMKYNLSNQDSNSMNSYIFKNIKKSKEKSNEITAEDILEIVKNGVVWDDGKGGTTKEVKLSNPYKSKEGFWLVAAFDKKTGKFLGAIWVGYDGGGFIDGPDSYSEYKDIISGKTNHKSSSNKDYIFENRSNQVIDEIPNYSERYVVGRLNPNISNNQNIQVINPVDNNLDNDYYIDLNQQPNMEGGNETKLIS